MILIGAENTVAYRYDAAYVSPFRVAIFAYLFLLVLINSRKLLARSARHHRTELRGDFHPHALLASCTHPSTLDFTFYTSVIGSLLPRIFWCFSLAR